MPEVNLADLNWLDWLVLLWLLASAWYGTRRGLLLGALDLVAAGVALGVAFVAEPTVADAIVQFVPRLSPAIAHVAAFIGLVWIVQSIIGVTLGRLVYASARALARSPLRGLERLLGALPGLAHGLIAVTLLLLPFALTPLAPAVSAGIERSRVANQLVASALEFVPTVQARLGQDFAGGLPSLIVAPPESPDAVERPLPIGPIGDLAPDPVAEQRMLELVNAERSRVGVRPLTPDDRLRDVARAHSLEMFQLDYFSHTSPVTGSPFDRMRTASIAFLVAGENLAFAPNVEIAHQGLMNSPGHRANILRTEFGRVGIGVIRSQFQGSMFSQEFTN